MTRTPDEQAGDPLPSSCKTRLARTSRFAALLAPLLCGIAFAADAPAGSSASTLPDSSSKATATTRKHVPERRVLAYYFHTNFRCPKCRRIEAFSDKAIETGFRRELESGQLEWRVVNTEEKGNEHFMKDFQLYTKSLVLVEQVKGEQTRWVNLVRVWELVQDEAAFTRYVQGEVRAYLAGTP